MVIPTAANAPIDYQRTAQIFNFYVQLPVSYSKILAHDPINNALLCIFLALHFYPCFFRPTIIESILFFCFSPFFV